LPWVSPPAAEDWCVIPSQNAPKSSTTYGLAMMKPASAHPPAMNSPRTAAERPPTARYWISVAIRNGKRTTPPVYFVAAAKPRPMPATA
jgi:hypothetical protein